MNTKKWSEPTYDTRALLRKAHRQISALLCVSLLVCPVAKCVACKEITSKKEKRFSLRASAVRACVFVFGKCVSECVCVFSGKSVHDLSFLNTFHVL